MYKPELVIDLNGLKNNAKVEKEELQNIGVEVMAVNKVFDGCIETAKAVYDAGIEVIAESRVYNLKKIKGIGCTTCLLRSPCLSEISEVVEYADISLNSEEKVIVELSKEAERQGKEHSVLLMVDMGDLREGVWFENEDEICQKIELINKLPNLKLYGIGTNYNCYGTVMPTVKNSDDFVEIVDRIQEKTKIKIARISAGNCTSYHLIDKGVWNNRLNHLRIGGLHEFGIEYVDMHYLDQYEHSDKPVNKAVSNLYILRAEIIEINSKPTVPVGELGVDAFLHKKEFEDRGVRKRALLAFGRQDVPIENCVPCNDYIQILGQTSDHTIIDIEDADGDYRLGDFVEFELDYTGLLAACQTNGVNKVFKK